MWYYVFMHEGMLKNCMKMMFTDFNREIIVEMVMIFFFFDLRKWKSWIIVQSLLAPIFFIRV